MSTGQQSAAASELEAPAAASAGFDERASSTAAVALIDLFGTVPAAAAEPQAAAELLAGAPRADLGSDSEADGSEPQEALVGGMWQLISKPEDHAGHVLRFQFSTGRDGDLHSVGEDDQQSEEEEAQQAHKTQRTSPH